VENILLHIFKMFWPIFLSFSARLFCKLVKCGVQLQSHFVRLWNSISFFYRCTCGQSVTMPKATECFCWNDLSEVNTKRMEKNVNYSGFRCNCLEINVLEGYYYNYQEANRPPMEDELIHEYM